MDIIGIIETIGIPVSVALGLGYALMYLIKFLTRDVQEDIKNLHDITVKLIDSNRESQRFDKSILDSLLNEITIPPKYEGGY